MLYRVIQTKLLQEPVLAQCVRSGGDRLCQTSPIPRSPDGEKKSTPLPVVKVVTNMMSYGYEFLGKNMSPRQIHSDKGS